MSQTLGGEMVPAWSLAVSATIFAQLGSALSTGSIHAIGSAGTGWLRLTLGAAIILAITRPKPGDLRWRDLPILVTLGIVTGMTSIVILGAITRISFGTAVAIEFLGPLVVAAFQSSGIKALVWPTMALLGVIALTEPWRGQISMVGIALAGVGAVCWGVYILLTQRVGHRFNGINGLAITIPVAALATATVGIPQAAGHITPTILIQMLGIAVLVPVLPYGLEMLALRRLTPTAFGTLMALEPAVGLMVGATVLSQAPTAIQITGIALVVAAGIGSQRLERPAI